ncbi:MAG: substrate-binding domain-containing protein [Oscillospiraceae bacterium]|nr:substrate-binding domain-containing protein [Oscillospiraceae bacterium]
MKKLLAVLLVLILAVGVAACAQTPPPAPPAPPADAPATEDAPEEPAVEQGDFTIGYVINNFGDTFQNFIYEAMADYAAAHGVTVINADANESTATQLNEVENMIVLGVDALIVVPVDTSAMEPITRAAQEAGIPLIYVNRNPFAGMEDQMPAGVYYVGSQEIEAGFMQMRHIGPMLGGEGGVAILQGILSNEGAIMRTEGNQQIIAEEFPGIDVLAMETANWQTGEAVTVVENWITAFGDGLNAVLANNDDMAIGAIRALQMAGREDVLVMGIDGNPNALEAIEEGGLVGSVFQDAVGQGQGSMRLALNALTGVQQDSVLWIPFQLITAENVADFK